VTMHPQDDQYGQPERVPDLLARGPQGAQGQAGQAGVQGRPGTGLPRSQRVAITWMFAVCMIFVGVLFLGLFHYARELAGQQHVVAAQQQSIDRQQRELNKAVTANLRQRCTSVLQDATIPITHPIANNPSREWEARFEQIDRQRAAQLHCNGG
jgi:hypothetical protein